MLSKPKFGWTTINIGDWSDRASYLSDIHLDLLDALIKNFNYAYTATIVEYDAEGWEGYILINKDETYIFSTNVYQEPKKIDIESEVLVKEIIKDIEENLDDWSTWSIYCDKKMYPKQYKKEKKENKSLILKKIKKLKKIYNL